MPSPELTRIIERYDANTAEGRNDPKRRIEACQQMWKLHDPEAIMFLKIIYEEDPDPLVQAEAAEVLTNFRRIQREREASRSGKKSKGTGLGWRLLRSILLLTFVGLLILNGLLFWVNNGDESGDGDTVVDSNGEFGGRADIVNALDQSLSDLIDDSLKLQNEWQKIQDGNSGDCTITLKRPQPLTLTNAQIEQAPDIGSIVTDEFGDYRFSFGAYTTVLSFWDAYCAGTLPDADRQGNVARLGESIGIAVNMKANIIPTLQAATAIPTIGPSPTNTLPPTETPPPTATLTPVPLANVRYEEHLSALERSMRDNQSKFNLILNKWEPDTRGRPFCATESLGAPYTLPPDQQGDPDLDEAARLVSEAFSLASQADALYLQHCNAGTLNLDASVDPTAQGLSLINTALSDFTMAQEKIDIVRVRLAN